MLACAIHMSSPTPLVLDDVDGAPWDDVADVVVIGLGAAGVTAAIEARERGADVIVFDRFEGGGATAISGGIYYAGDGDGSRPIELFNGARISLDTAQMALGTGGFEGGRQQVDDVAHLVRELPALRDDGRPVSDQWHPRAALVVVLLEEP